MKDIDTIFNMISSLQSDEIQKEGIEEGKKVQNFSVFFQPVEGKIYWENCAKIISGKNNSELERYYYLMLLWLRDMNWPGAEIIENRLKEFPPEIITDDLNSCIAQAKQTEDIVWQNNLISLRNEIINP